MTASHDPSFLEKFLGKNYKWWYTLKYTAKSRIASPMGILFQQLANFISSLAIYYLWYINGGSASIITYLAIGRTFQGLAENYVIGRFGYDGISGAVSRRLIMPRDYLWLHFVESVGSRIVKNFVNLGGFALAGIAYLILLGPMEWPQTWLVVSLPLFLVISYLTIFIIGGLAGLTSYFIRDKIDFFGVEYSYSALLPVLSGAIIPLDKFPFPIIFESLPTAWILHHPMQIYLGNYDWIQTLLVFAGGILWFIVLERLWRRVFSLAMKKNESVGL